MLVQTKHNGLLTATEDDVELEVVDVVLVEESTPRTSSPAFATAPFNVIVDRTFHERE
jgi:hypothetical protein